MPAGGFDLRERVRFERRTEAGDDGYGNVQYEWAKSAGPMAARISPTQGSEDVISDRLTGIGTVDILVRSFSASEALTPEDRCVDVRSGKIYNIRSIINPDEHRRYLLMLAERGVAT